MSPLHADLAGLPPLLIEAGGGEVLRDQICALARRAEAAGVAVELSVAPEMVHVFQLLTFAADGKTTPQPLESMARLAAFVLRVSTSGASLPWRQVSEEERQQLVSEGERALEEGLALARCAEPAVVAP